MKLSIILILLGVILTRFNFYYSTIDLLPNLLGYLLILLGLLLLRKFARAQSRSMFYSLALTMIFLLNECTKYYIYPYFYPYLYLALIFSLLLMICEIFLYRFIFSTLLEFYTGSNIPDYIKIYTILAVLAMGSYLYLCFFGGTYLLLNFTALLESLYLIYAFASLLPYASTTKPPTCNEE